MLTGKSKNIALIILAAGESSRMQQPKQLLPWGKTTLLGHAINVARRSDAKHVYTVLGANALAIQQKIDLSNTHCIFNPDWKKGIGASIASAAQFLLESETDYDALLFTLCDQPLINAEYLNGMIKAYRNGDKNIIATAYEHGNGVPVLFHKKFIGELLTLDGDSGAKDIIAKNSEEVRTIAPHGKQIDLDTYGEYQHLKNQTNL
ncbi:nucleotidyltransferase family protein [Maribacter polysiphoniae]|uniref:Molybdenum cofactor cytidylyltransferase n=1 Tax=Maribacter polysiphoniae TaxID=429344 RepID=A0A316DRV0_9FLAO|nr:nucleotidyltransferase family protein [Maribacter polysiphoniae]MBD1262889.1 nucleotidyltransferase family protein [Maribacter polysiphoniae]PWK20208.1 molybdenum cofactor cytidylyltransferase [Maribacter polysiphoniae]